MEAQKASDTAALTAVLCAAHQLVECCCAAGTPKICWPKQSQRA